MFKANINAIEKAGLRDKVIIMVGGAPVTQEYADAVGADGYAADASTAVAPGQGPDPAQSGRRRSGVKPARPSSSTAVKGPVLGCQMCGAVRAALDGHDLPDELPEDAAQRPLRRRARRTGTARSSPRCAASG